MKSASRSASKAVRTLSHIRSISKDEESPGTTKAERTFSTGSRRRRTRPRGAAPPHLPDSELTEEEFVKEWGITKDQEEQFLVKYRHVIEAEVGPLRPLFDKYYLRRFLRARQHDISRYHKIDRLGRPIYIQHLGQINVRALAKITTEERMLLFHIQEYERALRYIFPACSLIAGKHVSQTLAIMDLKGVGLRHLSADVKRILSSVTRTDQDNYPETLGKTLIINAPTVFRAIWTIVKPMLDVRTQAKIHVCPSDYMPELTRWVDPENIPSYLGGKSQGSLLDDLGPWHDPELKKEIDLQRARAESGATEPDSPMVGPSGVHISGANSSIGGAVGGDGGGDGGISLIQGEDSASVTDRDTYREDFQDVLSRRLSSYSSASAYLSAEEGGYYSSDGGTGTVGGGGIASTSSAYDGRGSSPLAAAGAGPRPPPVFVPRGRAMTPSSDGESIVADSPMATYRKATSKMMPGADGMPGATQVSILARVRALEDRLPAAERQIRQHLPANEPAPSCTVGQGTLLGRVATLEKAMDTLLIAQQAAMDYSNIHSSKARPGCCACCTIM
ncbi:hypothetical protein Ndes2526B_g00477 [Nannochloris sp. 'desiccata']